MNLSLTSPRIQSEFLLSAAKEGKACLVPSSFSLQSEIGRKVKSSDGSLLKKRFWDSGLWRTLWNPEYETEFHVPFLFVLENTRQPLVHSGRQHERWEWFSGPSLPVYFGFLFTPAGGSRPLWPGAGSACPALPSSTFLSAGETHCVMGRNSLNTAQPSLLDRSTPHRTWGKQKVSTSQAVLWTLPSHMKVYFGMRGIKSNMHVRRRHLRKTLFFSWICIIIIIFLIEG